jgi:preprotein translocase subunit SecE
MVTNDELMKKILTPEEIIELKKEVAAEAEKIKWGGKRENSGRKAKTGIVLTFTARLSAEEKEFIEYSRKNHLHLRELMQG